MRSSCHKEADWKEWSRNQLSRRRYRVSVGADEDSLLNDGGWHLGINMTPSMCIKLSPISGEVILNRHFSGKFLSLKDVASQSENERNTYVVADGGVKVGIVQIASRLVRRIDS
ncbi:MAG: phosphatidylserine decarboxylase, partial [Bacteroidales bacterium]|nr:phosphatidylserine decarboxylase [Bacteroidales bacterium]